MLVSTYPISLSFRLLICWSINVKVIFKWFSEKCWWIINNIIMAQQSEHIKMVRQNISKRLSVHLCTIHVCLFATVWICSVTVTVLSVCSAMFCHCPAQYCCRLSVSWYASVVFWWPDGAICIFSVTVLLYALSLPCHCTVTVAVTVHCNVTVTVMWL